MNTVISQLHSNSEEFSGHKSITYYYENPEEPGFIDLVANPISSEIKSSYFSKNDILPEQHGAIVYGNYVQLYKIVEPGAMG